MVRAATRQPVYLTVVRSKATMSLASSKEGKTFIGQKQVTTASDGKVTFTFEPAKRVGLGQTVTARATDSVGNTSEFSAPRMVVAQ